jgi:hypothetical protein
MPDRHSELPAHPDLEYYRKQSWPRNTDSDLGRVPGGHPEPEHDRRLAGLPAVGDGAAQLSLAGQPY